MSVKRFLVGLGIGFMIGYAIKDQQKKEQISPEKALKIVKKKVAQEGSVEGSWIYMISEDYNRQLLSYQVYRGGISAMIEGDFYQFDFIVDANTGTILELTSQE